MASLQMKANDTFGTLSPLDFQCEIHVAEELLQRGCPYHALTTFGDPVEQQGIDFESSFPTCFHPIDICHIKGQLLPNFARPFAASATQPPDIEESGMGGTNGMPSDTT